MFNQTVRSWIEESSWDTVGMAIYLKDDDKFVNQDITYSDAYRLGLSKEISDFKWVPYWVHVREENPGCKPHSGPLSL